MILLALPFKGDPAFSIVVKTLVKSHNILGTRTTPFDTGGVSLLEEGNGLLIVFLDLTVLWTLPCVESY